RLRRRRGQSLLAPFGLVFGGCSSDPRARRGNRGSGLARAWKESQAMIVGGISFEAAPATRQDYAETASIIVNGRKGLYEHGHRGASGGQQRAPCRRPRSFPSCWTSKGGTSTWCIEFVFGGKVLTIATAGAANSEWRYATGNHHIGDGAYGLLVMMLLLCALGTTQASAKAGGPEMFYSVDRSGLCQTGGTLNLWQQDPVLGRPFWRLPDWFEADDLRAHVAELFPDGLSLHGLAIHGRAT